MQSKFKYLIRDNIDFPSKHIFCMSLRGSWPQFIGSFPLTNKIRSRIYDIGVFDFMTKPVKLCEQSHQRQ